MGDVVGQVGGSGRGRRVVSVGIGLALLGALAGSPAAGAGPGGGAVVGPSGAPGDCPDVMPVADVAAGLEGTGWTVVQGQTPEAFAVEVLGVIADGVAPGRDIIVVEVSDEIGSDFIDRAGGIWAGMSGSPVYIGDDLVGAVAYGFSLGPSRIGGLTPAEDMVDILDYPGGVTVARRAGALGRDTVVVPRGMRLRLARRAGISVSAAASLHRLPVPLSVSGLSPRRLDRMANELDKDGERLVVVPGSRAKAPSGVPSATPVAGGNFAALISYGDVTAGGIGTATYVCDGQALAFGHPLLATGKVAFGANDADAITIVTDPTLTPFKLANIADNVGIVDQDRLAGLRADLSDSPELIPVTSRVRSWELDRVRLGETDVTMSDWVSRLAPFHVLSNIDTTIDRFGPGTSSVEFVIEGTRPNGDHWEIHRLDRVASPYDVSLEVAFALDELLSPIASNQFEDVHFDRVHVKAGVSTPVRLETIRRVQVSKNGGPFREPDFLRIRPGDTLTLRVTLRIYHGTARNVDVLLTVPNDAAGDGFLEVFGGSEIFGSACDFDPSACPKSFPKLLQSLEDAPRNDTIVASLELFDPFSNTTRSKTVTKVSPRVVGGFAFIQVVVVG